MSCCRRDRRQASGNEITLLDLATHHSGLPQMPDNLKPADMRIRMRTIAPRISTPTLASTASPSPPCADFLYSNLGFGLLGQALANRAGTTYPNLVQEEVTGPLGMSDTVVSLSPEKRTRLIQGYDSSASSRAPLGLGCAGRSRRTPFHRRRHAYVS